MPKWVKGQTGNPRGRPKKAELPSRNEILRMLTGRPAQLGEGTALDDAAFRLHEHICTSNSSASIEWLFNQLIGSPKSTVENLIADATIWQTLGDMLPTYFDSAERCGEFLRDLHERLKVS